MNELSDKKNLPRFSVAPTTLLAVFFVACAVLSAAPARASECLRGFLQIGNATTLKAKAFDTSTGQAGIQSGGPTNELYLATRTSQTPLRILSEQPNVLREIGALKEGDFVVATGQIDLHAQTVSIEAIDSVGLQQLLGVWRTDQWQVFEFRDFNRLNLYSSDTKQTPSMRLEKTREFSYVLAPDQPNHYSIFLSDDHSVHAGSLEFTNQKVHILVFDSVTGAVAEDISLSPMPL